jgi:hypothetical protein
MRDLHSYDERTAAVLSRDARDAIEPDRDRDDLRVVPGQLPAGVTRGDFDPPAPPTCRNADRSRLGALRCGCAFCDATREHDDEEPVF